MIATQDCKKKVNIPKLLQIHRTTNKMRIFDDFLFFFNQKEI